MTDTYHRQWSAAVHYARRLIRSYVACSSVRHLGRWLFV